MISNTLRHVKYGSLTLADLTQTENRDDEEWYKPEYRLSLGLKLESELNLNHPFLPLSAKDKRLEVDRRLTGNTHVLGVRSTTAYVIPSKVRFVLDARRTSDVKNIGSKIVTDEEMNATVSMWLNDRWAHLEDCVSMDDIRFAVDAIPAFWPNPMK